jgi:hypothetical protein
VRQYKGRAHSQQVGAQDRILQFSVHHRTISFLTGCRQSG